MQKDYPILEFDPSAKAIIEPAEWVEPADVPERCVICFFREVLTQVCQAQKAKCINESHWEDGPHHLHEIEIDGQRLALLHPGVGAPMAAGLLEETIALGCKTFIACGGAGVLERDVAVGHVVVPVAAIRDEGVSYHYLPPGREVTPSPDGVTAIEQTLQKHGYEYVRAKTWTTDAPYRETPEKVALRRSEGCLTVEMEAAAFFAVAQFRGITLAQMLYGGDDVSGDVWDHRDWDHQTSIRERLFWLAVEACLSL